MEMEVCVYGNGTLAHTIRKACMLAHCHVFDPTPRTKVAWMADDVPLYEDRAEYAQVMIWIHQRMPAIRPQTLVVVSSQMPVGTIAQLERAYPNHTFAYVPENIRVDHAEADWARQARIVVGLRHQTPMHLAFLETLLLPWTPQILWMTPESAEMVKHALNAWLGMNIAFINEIARIAGAVGADADDIASGLLTERRVGPAAPLHPGAPFGKGHLARDLQLLNRRSETYGLHTPILDNILESNAGPLARGNTPLV